MTTLIQNYGYREFWGPYDPAAGLWGEQRCTFDGEARRIIVNAEEAVIDVKRDIYSAWKEWVQVRDHAKFLPAIRTIGGDPVGGGQFAGDAYFLINGWRVVIGHDVTVTGTLYNDEAGVSPWLVLPGGGVTATVAALAFSVETGSGGEGGGLTAADVWTHATRTLTANPGPTQTQIAAAVRAELAAELARILELARIHGLVAGQPLTVTATQRQAGDITQTITEAGGTVTVARAP